MIKNKLELINEQTSPLFRIMWVYNADEPHRRQFDNNICAFHIGNGMVLSVAHNLKSSAHLFRSIDNHSFQSDILNKLDPTLKTLFDRSYVLDKITGKRYLNNTNPIEINQMVEALRKINFDTRWITFASKGLCKPYLIVQFRTNQYYNDPSLTLLFDKKMNFPEPALKRHTFLIELELQNSFESDDIAMYKVVNTNPKIVEKLGSIEPDFNSLENDEKLFCLQSSPMNHLGKLLNEAKIEGITDHWAQFIDPFGGNYIMEGLRYLIKGYFRFGSSGAPYIFYDPSSGSYKVNAIQSEACPIQLSINGQQEGNFQYVSALAAPLSSV